MTIEHRHCVVVTCDADPAVRCDSGWDDGVPHFDGEADALKHLLGERGSRGYGWTRRPDGRLLCEGCSKLSDCEATGHRWTGWLYRNQGSQHEDRGIQWRYCEHCGGGFEERLAACGNEEQR